MEISSQTWIEMTHFINIFSHFFKKQGLVYFPQWPLLAENHVFVTPTQKNKLYTTRVWNHHVPGVARGSGRGVGGLVGLQCGGRNLRRCQVTKLPLNSSGFHLSWGPEWKLISTTSLRRKITKKVRVSGYIIACISYHAIHQNPLNLYHTYQCRAKSSNSKHALFCKMIFVKYAE